MRQILGRYVLGMFAGVVMHAQLVANEIPTFEYSQLADSQAAITQALHDYGFIAVRGVPKFRETYEAFLVQARSFVALPDTVKSQCTPPDAYARGWSDGIEVFNGVRETHKGSFYAHFPEGTKPNIWPQDPAFKEAYVALAQLMFQTAREILPYIGLKDETVACSRMLYYKPVDPSAEDGNPYWCGKHCDHGVFTALCPEVYYLKGQRVDKPVGSGLYVRDQAISPPDDVMLFQIGETAEIALNGAVTATEHDVRKAYGDYERLTMALFLGFEPGRVLECEDPTLLQKFADRYRPGMTYQEWNDASFAKYASK